MYIHLVSCFHQNSLKATKQKMASQDTSICKIIKLCQHVVQAIKKLPPTELLLCTSFQISPSDNAIVLILCSLESFTNIPLRSYIKGPVHFLWRGDQPTCCYDHKLAKEIVSTVARNLKFYMRHIKSINQEDVDMEKAKEVHRSLRRGAGVLKYAQEEWVDKLLETPQAGSDGDPRVHTAYLNQATAEAQEVTIARAIELKHNAGLISALSNETSKMFTTAADSLSSDQLDKKKFGHWIHYLRLKAAFYMAYAYNYAGENMLNQDKCGDGIRSLQESKKYYEEASTLCKEYATTKGPGTNAKPEKHQFFRRIAPIINRTLEKCERENGMIYHQKVPYDPPQLELRATYGLVAPDDYTLPPAAPLWSPVAYAAFDLTKNLAEDPLTNSKAAQKVEGDLPPVKEAEIHHSDKDHKNNSGCSVM
ncbi:unnamed protein product, partial [Meganyctiphanes norvegica]